MGPLPDPRFLASKGSISPALAKQARPRPPAVPSLFLERLLRENFASLPTEEGHLKEVYVRQRLPGAVWTQS